MLILLDKIPWIAKLLDKLAEKYINEKLDKRLGKDKENQEHQIKALEVLLIRQLQEKEVLMSKLDNMQEFGEKQITALFGYADLLAKKAVQNTFAVIKENYILLPKNLTKPAGGQFLSPVLGKRILGEIKNNGE